MAGWPGWVDDVLRAIGAPTQPSHPPPLGDSGNPGFLIDWANSENSSCNLNPLVAYYAGAGSTNCQALPNGHHAQNYTTKAQALAEIKRQLESGDYPHLLAALRANAIYAEKTWTGVSLDMQRWGAIRAQANYAFFMTNTYGGVGVPQPPPQGGKPAPVAAAWRRWMHTLAHKGPDGHNRIKKATARVNRIAR